MYEITFHYHPRNEDDGKYNTEETLTFTKTVGKRSGKAVEEVPLEKVAVVVMGELARRDIWIVNVELYEFAKREVTFKETKGGIILKNRKFQFDQLHGELTSEEIEEYPQQVPNLQQQMPGIRPDIPIQFSDRATRQAPMVQQPTGPLRYEVFRPNREDLAVLQRQGLKLTLNKPYPVMKEVIKGMMDPIHYQVNDDQGQPIEVSSLFFEPMRRGLVGIGTDDPAGALPRAPEGKLSYVDTSPLAGGGDIGSIIAAQDAALARRGF